MSLFQLGNFTLRSGRASKWKIDCDDLTPADWEALAVMAVEVLPPFSAVSGVPRGGDPFAKAMARYVTAGANRLLLCEDVVTTGDSLARWRKVLVEDPQTILPDVIIGVCVFARGECPYWVVPLFQMPASRK